MGNGSIVALMLLSQWPVLENVRVGHFSVVGNYNMQVLIANLNLCINWK